LKEQSFISKTTAKGKQVHEKIKLLKEKIMKVCENYHSYVKEDLTKLKSKNKSLNFAEKLE